MSTFTNYKRLEKPLAGEKYNINVANKNNDIIDSELHKLDLKNQSQDELLATKQSLNSEIQRAMDAENINSNNLKLHKADANPHSVTKSQVGLGNADNTSDMDKPVSTAQQNALDTALSAHNTSKSSHSDMRLLISGLTTRLNALADSDDTTLDQLSEIVAYIKNNKSLIDGITTSKVNVSDIIDDLTTNSGDKVLSAKQGTILKGLITDLTEIVGNKVDKVSGKGLSTNDYTTAEKNKLGSVATGAEVNVQADWNVTDANSDAFIKNKPTSNTLAAQSLAPTEVIPANSDLDDYIKAGSFRVANSEAAKTIAHTPITNQGYILDIYNVYGASTMASTQIAHIYAGSDYARFRYGSNPWSDWAARKYTDTTYNPMTGATANAAGKAGLVPAPAAGDQNKVLKGDGSWADEKLKNPTYINGMTFTGTPEYGELSNTRMCSTAGNAAEKLVTFTGFSGYKNYARINVKFAYTNSASNPTLKINDTDPKPIYYKNRPVMPGAIKALKIYAFVYLLNGDRWEILGDLGEDNQNTAKTYYVSPDGDDSLGDGSSTHPWREINYAISHCPYGGYCNIYVDGGMYSPIHAVGKSINLYLKGDITFDGTGLNTDKTSSPLIYISNCILLFAKSGSDNNNRIVHFCNAGYCITAINRSLFRTDIKVELEFDNINNRAIHINYSDFVIYGKINFKSTCNLSQIIGAYFTSRIVICSESNNRSVFDAVANIGISCHNDIQVSLSNVDVTDNVENMVSGNNTTIVSHINCTFANNAMVKSLTALLINDINNQSSVETVDPMTATEDGFAADAKQTGAVLNELKTKMSSFEQAKSTIVSSALGKALGLAASTALATVASKIAGVVNRGAWTGSTTAYNGKVTIPAGYHNGSGYVQASITNRGAWSSTITTAGGSVTIPAGYHNGSGKVSVSGLYVPPTSLSGTVSIGNLSAQNVFTKTIVFSKSFASAPRVTASGSTTNNKSNNLSVSVTSISPVSFVLTVKNESGATLCEGVSVTWTAYK